MGYFVDRMRERPVWKLQDYVIDLYLRGQTHTEEFKILTNIYTEEKLNGIIEEYKKKIRKRETEEKEWSEEDDKDEPIY